MKAQVFYEPEKMQLEDLAIPEINKREVLVKVKACGICGSDISYYFGKTPLDTENGKGPLVLGHEFSGIVTACGHSVKGISVGDRVTVNPPLPCNHCDPCHEGFPNLCENMFPLGTAQNGAFAEYVKAPFEHVYKLPKNLSFEVGSIIEPFACAMHGVDKLSPQIGENVAIIGAGTIGLMMLKIIKARGAGNVVMIDIADYPLSMAKIFGADAEFNSINQNSPFYSTNLKIASCGFNSWPNV